MYGGYGTLNTIFLLRIIIISFHLPDLKIYILRNVPAVPAVPAVPLFFLIFKIVKDVGTLPISVFDFLISSLRENFSQNFYAGFS